MQEQAENEEYYDAWAQEYQKYEQERCERFLKKHNNFRSVFDECYEDKNLDKDMEILTYVLEGTVEHQDSMGNKEQVPAGEFQIMSAGTGIRHSEYNPSSTERLHLYQIWIMPEENGITPRYEQRRFDAVQGKQLVLSPDARDGSLKVHQDMELYRWALLKDEQSVHQIAAERRVWIQVVKGNVTINGVKASTSDGLAIWDEQAISIHADSDSEVLLFDLPPV